MTDLVRFEALLGELRAAKEAEWAYYERDAEHRLCHPYYVAQRSRLAAAYSRRGKPERATLELDLDDSFPVPKNFSWEKAAAACPELMATFAAENAVQLAALAAPQQAAEASLQVLAQELTIPAYADLSPANWIRVDEVSSSSYSSQGYGADQYAQRAVEQSGWKAELYGLAWEVRVTHEHHYAPGPYSTGVIRSYGCFVNTTEVGVEILRRKPDVSTREWVRLCWSKGVNPRVYDGMLPAGYEEANGLDYHGHDLRAAGCPA